MKNVLCTACFLNGWLFCFSPWIFGGEPSKAEVAKLGKASTALVEISGRTATGSAFCIHPSGLFVTNEHVVRDAGASGSITLVLNSGSDRQRSLSARVIRFDRELDLALLRSEHSEDLPALELGQDDNLTELADLVAVGFPFGKSLVLQQGQYPAVTVNMGRVTSLRRKEGRLVRIQMDAGVQPGNSGGPVLDLEGRVIGVVVAGIAATTVNFAIPVSHVARFLKPPDIEFAPPLLARGAIHRPLKIEARAVQLLPSLPRPSLEVVWSANGKENRRKMEPVGDLYRATIVPVPELEGDSPLGVAIRYPSGSVTGSIADKEVKLNGDAVKLSSLRSIEPPIGKVYLQNGTVVQGAIAGLTAVKVQLGSGSLQVDFSKALEINIEARASIEAIPFSIVASVDGKEVARVKKDIAIERTVAAGHAVQPKADSTGNLAAKEVRQLASTIGNVAVGGGGRYLILHLPRLRKLAIFDIAQRKVTRYLPLAEDQIRFTAGRDKLLVFLPANNVIQRWSLETFERELSTILPINGTVKTMAMGSDSAGPMVIQESGSRSQASLIFVDIQKMARLETRWEQVRGMPMLGDIVHIRSSPDGKVFGVWSSHMPCGLGVLHTEDGKFVRTYYEHLEVVHVDPGPLGDLVFTGGGVFTAEAKPFHGDRPDGNNYIPAVKGPYYLQLPGYNRPVRPPGSESPSGPLDKAITLWLRGDSRPLVTLANLDVPVVNRQQGLIDDFTYEKRFVFLPDDKLLITLPASNDQIVINRLNVDEELEKSGVDYLLVTSSAPPIAKSGSTYNYRLVVKSKRGGVKYRLDSAPSGMTIGSDGAIVWQVPRQYAEPDNSVIVTVSDSTGQETIHSFKVRIQD